MKTIVHLSDLHFGAIDELLVEPLVASVCALAPDIVALSGDLTQDATRQEFEQAVALLKRLPGNQIVVPGNHDMAFYNPVRRAARRLKLFRELVTNDPEPWYLDDELAVLGLNTARVSHLRNGRIRDWQILRIEERMAGAPSSAVRLLVTHHPFDLPSVFSPGELVGGGGRYMERVLRSIDVMAAGHMHVSHSGPTALRYQISGQSAVFVQAGTALSHRARGEPNAFQVIRTTSARVETEPWIWNGSAFLPGSRNVFEKVGDAWTPVSTASRSALLAC